MLFIEQLYKNIKNTGKKSEKMHRVNVVSNFPKMSLAMDS